MQDITTCRMDVFPKTSLECKINAEDKGQGSPTKQNSKKV